jgi:hypothetical protein
MPVDGTGQVGLLQFTQHVLDLYQHDFRGAAREILMQCHGQHRRHFRHIYGVRAQALRQQLFPPKRHQQPCPVFRTPHYLRFPQGFAGKQAQLDAQIDVTSAPKAGQRR